MCFIVAREGNHPIFFFQSRVISCFPNFLMSGQLAGRIISGIKSLNARVKCVVFQPFMSVLPCFSRFFLVFLRKCYMGRLLEENLIFGGKVNKASGDESFTTFLSLFEFLSLLKIMLKLFSSAYLR